LLTACAQCDQLSVRLTLLLFQLLNGVLQLAAFLIKLVHALLVRDVLVSGAGIVLEVVDTAFCPERSRDRFVFITARHGG
jgi:hypothetical protein